ncbi:MAG: CDGSH iron-sulfur domain-containing protein [Clostridiaceae bacterium]|nr:CDGSH iron-sulfur domain-containing protein [Clostridiaceae bacterium]
MLLMCPLVLHQRNTIFFDTNRTVLCRCGKSKNKPFCDTTHLLVDFVDK